VLVNRVAKRVETNVSTPGVGRVFFSQGFGRLAESA